ncbi:LysR family transcriptional regulator [Rhizobium leguminosarum]|nr:LysR family transcriptional regulator [Rhizobium leguminosarum]TBH02142.1 LysR family transcriptional regulator [Rhizobium leguminosarum]TBH36600.1 LysR family transcriptional regulator [Rhizobium leguminosarum]TBH41802.1 LysR family transcriptional regulator [Rhizobium leguminosarum]TBH66828.1 LysR family transcriptional regulator [Rhizobium leguminosarum]
MKSQFETLIFWMKRRQARKLRDTTGFANSLAGEESTRPNGFLSDSSAMKSLDPLAGVSVFLKVAETLNFSRAAEQLGMSKATVSVQLQELEKRLGVRLVQRNTRSVALTEAGDTYRQSLGDLLGQVNEAQINAKALQDGTSGQIRLSVSPDLGQRYLSGAVADFSQLYPEIDIFMDFSLEPVDLVERGMDLAVRSTIANEQSLIVRRLATTSLVVCASPGYLRGRHDIVVPTDLLDHRLLHFSPLRWGREWHFQKSEQHEKVSIPPRIEANDSIGLKEAAIRGAGITLLPRYLVTDELRNGQLVEILEDWVTAKLEINAVFPANRHISAKVKALVAHLSKALRHAFEPL